MNLTVGVIGAGIIAEEHLKALETIDGIQAIAIVDINEERADLLAREFKLSGYFDYRNMIEEEAPDIVVITLPHYLHKEAAIHSANQGCHILLEKPMALNSSECEEIIYAAEENKVHLMVGHIQHYFQENIIAKRILEEGLLGELLMINETRHMSYFTNNRPSWFLEAEKAGGGIVMNLGAHCIDKIQWLLDSGFSSVLSKLTYKSKDIGMPTDIEGSGLLYLETDHGIPVTISMSGYEVVPKHVTEFVLTKGMLRVEVGKGVWVSQDGGYKPVDYSKGSSPFVRQFKELIDAIHGEGVVENSGHYAKSIIQVIEGCYQSNQQGEVIKLPQNSN